VSDSNSGVAKVVGLVASLAAVGLIFVLMNAGSVEVAGMSVPVWLLAIVCYVLGAAAVWGTTKGQKG
jgi:hypothetical protein